MLDELEAQGLENADDFIDATHEDLDELEGLSDMSVSRVVNDTQSRVITAAAVALLGAYGCKTFLTRQRALLLVASPCLAIFKRSNRFGFATPTRLVFVSFCLRYLTHCDCSVRVTASYSDITSAEKLRKRSGANGSNLS